MNPQGWFQSVTWLPKPVNTQALIGFPYLTTIQVPISLLPILHHSREWTSTLLCHAVPQAVLLLIQDPTQLVQNLNAGTLKIHICEKTLDTGQCISDMQASSHGWITPVTTTTHHTMANSSAVWFPFPIQDAWMRMDQ
jgi:hypothetical protein